MRNLSIRRQMEAEHSASAENREGLARSEEESQYMANAVPQPTREDMVNNMELSKDTRISDIAMLGSHDAGTYDIKNVKGISVCQHLNLVDQAKAGIQYFDLRVRTNKKGVWKFYHGEKNKGRGFNASGPAEVELSKLFDYARKHPKRLFLFKFHFDKSTDKEDKIHGFLNMVVNGLERNLIEKGGKSLLGQVTMGESVYKGKNIGILTHHTGNATQRDDKVSKYSWNYGENTYGGWGKTPKAKDLIAHLKKNIQKENTEGKILVSQTNLPAMIPPSKKVLGTPDAWSGLKKLASKAHAKVAKGVEESAGYGVRNPGVISGDFVDTEFASTDAYRELRDVHNRKHHATPRYATVKRRFR